MLWQGRDSGGDEGCVGKEIYGCLWVVEKKGLLQVHPHSLRTQQVGLGGSLRDSEGTLGTRSDKGLRGVSEVDIRA